ncbi:MAG: riboflavin kinase/FMN adenylyltransferase [Bacteroidetes bacterium]|jgi:riboflavin kinase/FMN adenylyltransferase|nr:riboflavin kinase/FMN adenylyltransferase [Bacteroidota bacterium]
MPKVYFNLNDFPSLQNTIITIGTFDGVHKGHRKILQRVNELKSNTNYQSLVFTFDPHPRKVLFPEQKDLKLITTTDEKIELLASTGIDYVLVYPFSKEFADLSSEEYIGRILKEKLGVKKIIIGYDHRFGRNREGNIDTLRQYAAKLDFEVHEISAEDINSINISSSHIRKAIDKGDVEIAADFLGYPFFISGIVTEGKKLGRTIGYPTANIKIMDPDKILPAIGVYAVTVKVGGSDYQGMLNIGTNPTTDTDNKIKIEVNIFDFDKTIYGENIRINFVKRLRDEVKFANLEELKNQLYLDKVNTLKALN